MNNPAKVTLKYHSGGFGPIDQFYTEKLVITFNTIEYKKEWEINKRNNTNDCYDYSKRMDISWKLITKNQGFIQVLHETNSFLGFDIDASIRYADVCDGDWLDYEVILPDGLRINNGFAPCAFPKIIERLASYINKFITESLPIPSFLQINDEEEYDDDQD